MIINDFKKLVVSYIITVLLGGFCLSFYMSSPELLYKKLLGGFLGCIGSYRMIFDSPSLQSHAGPAWFLLSIFWCRSYFNMIFKYKKDNYLLISFILFSGFWLIGMLIVNIPLCIGSGFTGLLFYAIGVRLKEFGLYNFKNRHYILFVIIWLFAAYYGNINMSQYSYCVGPGLLHNIISFPVGLMGAIFGTLVVCKLSCYVKGNVERLFGYIGRYTLEILCCHTLAFSLRSIIFSFLGVNKPDVFTKDITLFLLSIGLTFVFLSVKTLAVKRN